MAGILDHLAAEPHDTPLTLGEILRLCEVHRPNRIARLRFIDIFGNEAILIVYEPLVGTGVVWVCLAYKPDNYTYYLYNVTTGVDFINKAGTAIKSTRGDLTLADLISVLFDGANGIIRAYTPRQTPYIGAMAAAIIDRCRKASAGKKQPTNAKIEKLRTKYPYWDASDLTEYKKMAY